MAIVPQLLIMPFFTQKYTSLGTKASGHVNYQYFSSSFPGFIMSSWQRGELLILAGCFSRHFLATSLLPEWGVGSLVQRRYTSSSCLLMLFTTACSPLLTPNYVMKFLPYTSGHCFTGGKFTIPHYETFFLNPFSSRQYKVRL